MGGKRKKLRDIVSPPQTTPPPAVEDDELLDDLFAQLDSNDKTVQNVSAEVINDIQLSQLQEKNESQKQKKDSKTRFLERQVRMFFRVSHSANYSVFQARKAAEIVQHYSPGNSQVDAQIGRAHV